MKKKKCPDFNMTVQKAFLFKWLLPVFFALLLACSATASSPLALSVQAAEAEEEHTEDDADRLWNEEYYRAVDTTGGLSEAEVESLDSTCLEFMQTWKADLSLLAVKTSDYEGSTLDEMAEGYYTDCGFGYGSGRDGFQMVWDTETGDVVLKAFGAAQSLVPESYLEYVTGSVVKFEEEYGHFGPMYATARHLSNYLRGDGGSDGSSAAATPAGDSDGNGQNAAAASSADDEADSGSAQYADIQTARSAESRSREAASDSESRMLPDGQMPADDLRVGADSAMPAWYPKDPASFPFYHDETAARVVDVADIFSDEEEVRMEARLSEIRQELGRDIVIFTDLSTYGLSHSVYAADFYDFNGYGIGDDREGVCLMICMDPEDRGWWCCCTGPVTMGLYTEEVANQIDDLLYEYMLAGDYGPGVEDWIENFRRLYVTGSPYNEAWALTSADGFSRFHDPDAPRVVDDAGLLTTEEIDMLRAQASGISEQYGVDVVVHTALHEGILDRDTFPELFYITHGYGLGENYDGIQLTIFKRPNESGRSSVTGFGAVSEKLTDVNKNRLEDRCDGKIRGSSYLAASQWLSQAEHMLRTGRAPRSADSWSFTTIAELLVGLIFGGISLGRAKAGMATPKIRENADAYLVPGSLKVRRTEDIFLHSTVDRRYSPLPKDDDSDSGSSSGGGSSSYSSSYSGSSGSSHSGSGRSF